MAAPTVRVTVNAGVTVHIGHHAFREDDTVAVTKATADALLQAQRVRPEGTPKPQPAAPAPTPAAAPVAAADS